MPKVKCRSTPQKRSLAHGVKKGKEPRKQSTATEGDSQQKHGRRVKEGRERGIEGRGGRKTELEELAVGQRHGTREGREGLEREERGGGGVKRKRPLTDHTSRGESKLSRRETQSSTRGARGVGGKVSHSQSKSHSSRSPVDKADTDNSGRRKVEEGRGKMKKEVKVFASAFAKWKPVSTGTRKLLTDAMMSSMEGYLEHLRGSTRKTAQIAIQGIIDRVDQDISTTTAPPTKRFTSHSELKQRVAELKEKCILLVEKNSALEQRLEERTMFIKEREQAVAQILAMAPASCRMQAHSDTPPEVDGGPNTPPGMEGSDDEAFTDFIQSLVSDRTDHASLNDCLPLATGTALESTAPL